ncbi:MarR family winged helix-turn-helix transcriptional regulator [Actinoplanes sp. HUAS TT8]|uniref:MarR family winged helix-turn-helix transcriptional regulator n=1 Tax=Actinoplanes sp. HUAS TT8 TaxID=3447453 RepID=UPI003F5254CE
MTDDSRAQRDRILEALRNHGMAFGDLGRQFGTTVGLHVTDATALVEILNAQDRGAPLTPGELSQRIGLTAGATSSLLNRLESVGHVIRVRENADRRVVTLHADKDVDKMLDDFFAPLVQRMGAMMAAYPPEILREFERLLVEVSATMNTYLSEVADHRRLSAPSD